MQWLHKVSQWECEVKSSMPALYRVIAGLLLCAPSSNAGGRCIVGISSRRLLLWLQEDAGSPVTHITRHCGLMEFNPELCLPSCPVRGQGHLDGDQEASPTAYDSQVVLNTNTAAATGLQEPEALPPTKGRCTALIC
ncbi:hypothetical protein SKAU_G00141090 [Synaphobranchus kaupii]|uniref:Uncharacterized protein n=1 Tax=Synaphobranchus kaupii TaxID=118154 RepID=A0A9Q1FSI4_SYNKA|nr:hypothetical protein SKAU_G00141090 [Synaphobranchus kaupii]